MARQAAALLFDMDGLLLDTERVALETFLEAVGPLGVPREVAEPFFLTLIGTSTRETRARVANFLPDVDTAPVIAEWEAGFRARLRAGVPLRPGVGETLPRLQEAGVRMAVVTSTHGTPARHHLNNANLLHFFETVTGGDEVSRTKPDPAPYLETAAKLGVNPVDCAAFEDSDRGIAAAVAAGCRAVQIPDLRPAGPLPDLGQIVASSFIAALEYFGLP